MNSTDRVILSEVKEGQRFSMPEGPFRQVYVIERVWDFSDKPEIKGYFNQRNIFAILTLHKPAGRVRFMAPLCRDNTIWRADIERVPGKFS